MNEGHYIFDYSQEFIHKLEVGLLSRVMGQVLLFLIGGGKVQEGRGLFIMVFRPPTISTRNRITFYNNLDHMCKMA